jgi:hypothetical protein
MPAMDGPLNADFPSGGAVVTPMLGGGGETSKGVGLVPVMDWFGGSGWEGGTGLGNRPSPRGVESAHTCAQVRNRVTMRRVS